MADALISLLLEKLASVVFEHTNKAATHILNAEKDVQSFSSNLKVIQAVLEDAEKKQLTNVMVRHWLQELKDVSYDMDDILDEWNTIIMRGEENEGEIATCFPILIHCFGFGLCFGFRQMNKVYHASFARRIEQLDKKLNVISAEKENHDFHLSTILGTDEQLTEQSKTSSLVDVSTIFGFEEEKEMLLSKLLRESNRDRGRFLVISIVGIGGIGKTTLTRLAYNSENVRANFDKRVWVCVTDPFDEVKVAKAIIKSLDKNETQRNSNDLETLLLCIKTHVESKKFLLVLDNVWMEDEKKWKNLRLPVILQRCAKGSTILVTTQKEEVARMMRATSSMILLKKLSDMNCLALFNSIAFLDRDANAAYGLEAIGVKIMKKCKGLPLATKTLGSLVWHKKTRKEWVDVLNSQIWELEIKDQVFHPLLLSYYDLAPAVKMCLLYCAIFPKNFELRKDELIELWMSQDYLNSKENKDKRIIGQNYFESLAMRSFFQDFDKDEWGNISGCKMHEIVHDFVQFLCKQECIIVEAGEGADERMELSGDKVRHLTITSVPDGQLATSRYGSKKMRTLTILNSKITCLSPDTICQMKCLRTLNLSGNALYELPREIGELIHLRYLDLSGSEALFKIPEAVCDLYNLQTLNLRFCSTLEELPKAMGKLINLKHLYVLGCYSLRYLPKEIGRLKNLKVLDCFHVYEGEGDEALELGDLGMMHQLQGSLEIIGLGKKDAGEMERAELGNKDAGEMERAELGNKEHLSKLQVWFHVARGEQRKGDEEIVEAMQPHENLESLLIWDCHGTIESLNWINSLHSLRQVYLGNWQFWEVLPPLGKLPSLEILEIKWMEKVKKVGVEFLGTGSEETDTFFAGILFPKLKSLSFGYMFNWEQWEGITTDSSDTRIMPCLSELRIAHCPELRALPDFLYKITTLRTLEINYCSILEGEYEKGVGKQWHNISHIPYLRLGH